MTNDQPVTRVTLEKHSLVLWHILHGISLMRGGGDPSDHFDYAVSTLRGADESHRSAAAPDGGEGGDDEAERIHDLWTSRIDDLRKALGIPDGAIGYDPGETAEETIGNIVGQLRDKLLPNGNGPSDWLDHLRRAVREARGIRLDLEDFDGDKRGISAALGEAEDEVLAIAMRAPVTKPAAPDGDEAGTYTHQSSYDRGWQDAMGATLRAVTDTPAGQFRDDVWQLLWALTYGWAWKSTADKHVKEIRVDGDRFRAIRGACDRLRLWHDNPAAALRTDPGHGDAVKALYALADELRTLMIEAADADIPEGNQHSELDWQNGMSRALRCVREAIAEAEGRQP